MKNKKSILIKCLMRIIIIMIVVLVGGTFSLPANAATTTNQTGGTAGTWVYTLTDGNATNVYCTTTTLTGTVTVPSKLDGYTVTSIGEWMSTEGVIYKSRNNVTSVIIPNTVTSIGRYAFCDCTNLTSVTVPNSVRRIEQGAFQNCRNLTNIIIPNTVTYVGWEAFYKVPIVVLNSDSTRLLHVPDTYTSYTIPSTVKIIGVSAFSGCSSLTSILIPSSVEEIGYDAFNKVSIVVLNSDNTILLHVPETYTSYTIPSTITSIGDWAFESCTSLTSVTIPNSVTSIGMRAFIGCSGLTSITIPDSVVDIGYYAFRGVPVAVFNNDNTKLIYVPDTYTTYTIPNTVITIGQEAFYGCIELTSVTIPNSVTSIGDFAFWECIELTSVIIPNSVTSIGIGAFYECSSLTSITISNSVISIGEAAFNSCTNLSNIIIPDSVTSIGSWAFYDCPGSTTNKIIIPKNITYIGEDAFYNVKGVYYYPSNPVAIAAAVAYTGEYAWSTMNELGIPSFDVIVNELNNSAIVKIIYPNEATIKEYKIGNDGEWTNYTTEILCTTNCTVYARCEDADGGKSEATKVISILGGVTQSPTEGYADNTYPDDKKWFKYYLGIDKRGITTCMLVAGNEDDKVKKDFNRSHIIDTATNKYKDGIFYIDRDGKIKKY